MSLEARRSVDVPESTPAFALKMLLIVGSFWFLTALVVIVFLLGTMIR